MILIFGGKYQGKLDYAVKTFNLSEADVYKCSDDNSNTPSGKMIIYEIDKWVLSMVNKEIDVEKLVQEFIENNKNAIVICNDISSGIVPIDPVLRKWREAVGRTMTALAKSSDEVIRLFCGIPARIK